MLFFKRFLTSLFILLFFFTVNGSLLISDDSTPIALIKKIIKDVEQRKDDVSDWELAKTGLPLSDGQEVRTGSKSLALILFTDGSGLLRVRENSIANIYGKAENRTVSKNTFIARGRVGFDVNKQNENEEFTFTTPTVVASIRGTSGYFDVDDTSSTIVCETGLIELQATGRQRQSGTLTGGNTANINNNGEVFISQITEGQQNQLKRTKQTETKKIRIRTPNGIIEIEYLSGDN